MSRQIYFSPVRATRDVNSDHTSYCQTVVKPQAVSMPALTRECLALKLRQNWLAKHPIEAPAPALDDSLTSLNWLQNLNIMKMTSPTPPASPVQLGDPTQQFTPQTQVNPNAVLNIGNVKIKQEPGNCGVHVGGVVTSPSMLRINGQYMDVAPPITNHPSHVVSERIDYKTNPYVKPPYSYATLICMAMKETKRNKITLAGIYTWITENFIYYRHADPSWQNSIRHNLSLNKCFQKVPRRKDEPGKGGFWRINPEYESMFINGIFKKRRASNSPVTTLAPLAKRLRSDGFDDEDDSDAGSSLPSTPVDNSPMLTSTSSPLLNVTRHHYQKIHALTSQHQQQVAGASVVDIKQEPRDVITSATGHHHHLHHHHSSSSASGGRTISHSSSTPAAAAVHSTRTAPQCTNTTDDAPPSLDFNWNSILLQDIDVGGTKVKTEDIIDQRDEPDIASPIISLSPPPSDSNSDISIDDLLNNANFAANEFENPIDFESGEPLDLSISGMSLKPPDWWSESLNDSKGFLSPGHQPGSGLDTPVIAQSPMGAETDTALADHPWAENRDVIDSAISSFDTDITNLFDIDNIPSPAGLTGTL